MTDEVAGLGLLEQELSLLEGGPSESNLWIEARHG